MMCSKWMFPAKIATVALAGALLLSLGCGSRNAGADRSSDRPKGDNDQTAAKTAREKKIEASRARLSAEDRVLVDAQDSCPVTGEKLGSMGVPLKLLIKGQAVFICCKGCTESANSDPDRTVKSVEKARTERKP